eukprot:358031-Chlamydomonas_euryale.AAC.1
MAAVVAAAATIDKAAEEVAGVVAATATGVAAAAAAPGTRLAGQAHWCGCAAKGHNLCRHGGASSVPPRGA